MVDLFESLRPHQIYAAGDLSDPHGTHRICLQACMLLPAAGRCLPRPTLHGMVWHARKTDVCVLFLSFWHAYKGCILEE